MVEFSGREQATGRHERLVQLVHHRGLADAGISGHKHELRCAANHNPVEASQQSIDLSLSAVELLRDQQAVGYIANAEQKRIDPAMRLTFPQTSPQIGFYTPGGPSAPLECRVQ